VNGLKSTVEGLTHLDVLKLITIGTDHILGEGSSSLLFETLRLVYGIKPSSIPSQLDNFETLARRVMGRKASQAVINEIIAEVKKYKKEK
jgi:hypothetical protein